MANYWEQQPVSRVVVADAFYEPIDTASFRRDLGKNIDERWVQTGSGVAGALVVPDNNQPGYLLVPEFAPLPNSLFESAGMENQPIYRSDESPSFAVYQLPEDTPKPDNVIDISFEDELTLLGYKILEGSRAQIQLITYWQVESSGVRLPGNADIAVFIHLVTPDGTLLAQHDGMDAALTTVQRGDRIIQHHVIGLPETLPDQALSLEVGLYHRNNGQRLNPGGTTTDSVIIDFDLQIVKR